MAQLLLAVAEGVAEAHRHGIVHRDLKPANVLVTPERQVKLLDFGIAKLSDESEAEMPGAVPMTPAYAAPEQIRGQELTPATDVYALGVMLFQLLTGRLPHAREGMPLPIIAAGLSAETLARPEGDLGWVAIRALQPDAAARYASAGEFADDLRRYLDHRPVLARPASPAYRAARFFRRLFALAFPDDRSG